MSRSSLSYKTSSCGSCEYTVYDSEADDFVLVEAYDWKEATDKAYDLKGYLPRDVNAVRPRTGDCSTPELDEFYDYLQEHF